MKIAFGCDHAGWALKSVVMDWLSKRNIEVIDFGTYSAESVDYPDYAASVAKSVQKGDARFGILICGTGLGMAITADKFEGIRAVTVSDCVSAEMARAHNNANILAFGARIVGPSMAEKLVETFLNTKYAGGRHDRRLDKIVRLTSRGSD